MQLATPQSMTSLRLPSIYMIYLVGSRGDVIVCGVELHQGFWATQLPLATKAKMFVHPSWKMFTVGESRPILLMQIMYNAVKKLRDGLASTGTYRLCRPYMYILQMWWIEFKCGFYLQNPAYFPRISLWIFDKYSTTSFWQRLSTEFYGKKG